MNTENENSVGLGDKLKNTTRKIFRGEKAKRNIGVIILFLIAFGGVYYKFFRSATPTTYEYAKAELKDLQTTVEGSGTVISQSELNIQQLQSGGKVTSVKVKPGDFVKQGQIIATLDNRQAAIQVQQARAAYQKLINGSTKESLDITNQNLLNAKASYEVIKKQQDLAVENARRSLLNTNLVPVPVYDSKIQANTPTISGTYTCAGDVVYDIKVNQPSYADITGGDAGIVAISSVPQAIGSCGLFISFDSSKDYSNGEWKLSLPNKLGASYNTNLNAYNSALQARDQALLNASTSVTNAQLSLNQQAAPARSEDIMASEASLASANLAYENTLIRAPFDGQIGSVSAIVGQQTNSQQGVATIITKTKLAQVSLNEVDVVNVKVGQDVNLTFDAIPGETFHGKVYQMDTVGSTVSNVASFGVKISIDTEDDRIKSGMSVTANIITESKNQVLTIPSSAIKTETKNSIAKKYVLKKQAPGVAPVNTKTYITVGLDNNVSTEVVEGLNLGDQVVTKTNNGSTTAKTTTGFSLFGGGGGGARAGR